MIKTYEAKIILLNGNIYQKEIHSTSASRAFRDIHSVLESTNHVTVDESDESLHVVMSSAVSEIIVTEKK